MTSPPEGGGEGVRLRLGDGGGAAADHQGARPFFVSV